MPHIYLAPWEWRTVTVDETLSCWCSPNVNSLGAFDLRSQPELGPPPRPAPGYGLFVYQDPQVIPDSIALGTDPQGQVRNPDRRGIEQILGVSLAETSVLGIIRELLMVHADGSGQTHFKPLRTSRQHGVKMKLGGFAGLLIDEPFNPSHPSFQKTLDVYWADYRRNVSEGVQLRQRQQMTAVEMLKLYGRMGDDLLPAVLPPEHQSDGWRTPATTRTESFTGGDQATLAGDLSWTEVAGDYDRVSNAAQNKHSSGHGYARAEADVDGDEHYVEADIVWLIVNHYDGICTRFASTASTFYCGFHRGSNQEWYIRRFDAGTPTSLASTTTGSSNSNGTYRLSSPASDVHDLLLNGSSELTASDSTISGNTRGGIFTWGSNGTDRCTWDDWEISDLAAGAALTELIPETEQIPEVIDISRSLNRLPAETEQIPETIDISRSINRPTPETEQVSEASLTVQALNRFISETANLTEDTLRALTLIRQVAEQEDISEATLFALGITRAELEQLTLSEATLFALGVVRSRAEQVDITEATLQVLGQVRSISESLSLTEATLTAIGIVRDAQETLQMAEASLVSRSITRLANENVSIIENILPARVMVRPVSEVLTQVEQIAASIALIRLAAEQVSLIDSGLGVLPSAVTAIISLTLPARSLDLTLPSRSMDLTIPA